MVLECAQNHIREKLFDLRKWKISKIFYSDFVVWSGDVQCLLSTNNLAPDLTPEYLCNDARRTR